MRSSRDPRDHPGAANYPAGTPRSGGAHPRTGHDGTRNGNPYRQPPTHNPHLPPLDETTPPDDPSHGPGGTRAIPRKVTVTRVAAMRGRELTFRGWGKLRSAATADGADRSGLEALTYPTIVNYAVDAAMTVALANTLFFAAANAESKGKVALYLLLTIAPFALVAPLIGPMLDKLQRGRRIAMATTFGLRVLLALLIMANCAWDATSHQVTYDPWVLYPCALGLLVLSKSFGVLKSAVTPRVLPPSIDLVRVNSRLTTFGLVGGTVLGGAIAAAFEMMLGKWLPLHLPGAMVWLAVIALVGAVLCMRIPSWVEVTAGEVPTTLTYHGEPARPGTETRQETREHKRAFTPAALAATIRQPLGRLVVTGLWGNGTIRILTGFLTLFIAFYAKSNQGSHSGWMQLAMLGGVGAAAGIGNFVGNAAGTRLELRNPSLIVVASTGACLAVAVLAAVFGNILFAVLAALVASGTSAIGKVCLDSSIQHDLPEESRASAFGRSETVLQLSWVFGAALGVLLPPTLWIGFTVVAVLLAAGLAQTVMSFRGSSLIPGFGGKRPVQAMPTGSFPRPDGYR
ncbi:MFS transporter [Williamsia sterculiae]|uniref:Major Facilitator Superfamily protein n=1 Tax=Williamsia sterculiae TaxID=1344003 RepID=A0A1N7GW24_9NOCA|nr:MFS transporter [Williamsia sterculiae]SIS16756.1 Major Facilitator Superfamily protein [Williamsia sterculiae]